MTLHLITGEYPPQPGGVSDYVFGLATHLARAGEEVEVWCPPTAGPTPDARGVRVRREMGRFGRADLARVGRLLDAEPAPRRLLLQWVPHAFGQRSMNLGLCLWLLGRKRHGDRVEVMVHEPGLPFAAGRARQNVAAAMHRVMAAVLLRAAERVWVSTPAWERRWRPYALGRNPTFTWTPIPSAIPVRTDPAAVSAIRGRVAPRGEVVIGHFGMYRPVIREMLAPILTELDPDRDRLALLLLGRGGDGFRDELVAGRPAWTGRVHAPGLLPAEELSHHLHACDLMLQPYPDGVNGRQSSIAAVLAHGLAAVTTVAESTEPLWVETGAVALVAADDARGAVAAARALASDPAARERLGERARALYERYYDWDRIVAAIRSA